MTSLFKNYAEVWQQSQKEGGESNFFDYFIYRRISTLILCFIRDMDFSPNVITTLSVFCSVIAGLLFIISNDGCLYWIAILFMMLSLVTDTLDGQYARLKNKQSEFGGWYDAISDSMKYIILFISLTIGSYYQAVIQHQWYLNEISMFVNYPEIILLLGMIIISNFYLVYHIHATRYKLSFNPGTIVNLSTGKRRFHFGIESTLYTIFLVFLCVKQVYWLFIFLVIFLPFAWIFPFYKTCQLNGSSAS